MNAFAEKLTRVALRSGHEPVGGQAPRTGVAGYVKDITDNVQLQASNLTGQVENIAEVTKAVGAGLVSPVTVGRQGEISN